MTADQIRPEEDVAGLRKAFEDHSRDYRQRVWRHRKKSGELIHVKVVSFNLEFSGRPARLGVIYDVTEQVKRPGKTRERTPTRVSAGRGSRGSSARIPHCNMLHGSAPSSR